MHEREAKGGDIIQQEQRYGYLKCGRKSKCNLSAANKPKLRKLSLNTKIHPEIENDVI